MAKTKKPNLSANNDKQEESLLFDEIIASLPSDVRKVVDKAGIKSLDDVFCSMLLRGVDPLKMSRLPIEKLESGDFSFNEVMLDEKSIDDLFDDDEDYDDEDYDDEEDYDEDEEDDDDQKGFDDESYLLGLKFPRQKFIGPSTKEFHIHIKLNKAPVSIWRELVVPSNITLELLAYVLIEAMGWEHEHMYHFIGQDNVFYVNGHEIKEYENNFMGFLFSAQRKNSEKTSLEMVLQPKGVRLEFEYDFGDSWSHELWVKGERNYAKGEEPVIKLLKAQGECPPEDCGGVYGYAELLRINKKQRKSADDKERLEWFDIPKNYDPEDCDLEWLQDNVEALWMRIKNDL